MDRNNRRRGNYFSILGDSISTLAGYNPPECGVFYDWANKRQAGIYCPGDTWWGQVIEALDGRLLANHAWSGSLVCRQPQCEIESYGCSDARIGGLAVGSVMPDVVMIFMGLNDFGWAMPPESAGAQDLSVFSVAYDTMLQKIHARYPRAEVWCLTLPRSTWSTQPDFEAPLIRGGWHLEDYNRAIRRCARNRGCKLMDLAARGVVYDTIDGYHPTCGGMQAIAAGVLAQLKEEEICHDH